MHYLPRGKRFVDLFGGGFSMSHIALLSNKYESVFYNEFNPIVRPMLEKAIKGEFNYDVFKPEFVERETFFKFNTTDGYIRYCWSFSNQGDTYMFGKPLEEMKRSLHNFVVFGTKDKWLQKNCHDIDKYIVTSNIKERRILLNKYFDIKKKQKIALQQLQCLERLQDLSRLKEKLESGVLVLNTGSYEDYQYQEGDVVYCDPPYENTAKYNSKTDFDIKKFYDWVATRPFKVYFSSYLISDDRFKMVWAEGKRSLMAQKTKENYKVNYECLYTNMIGEE